MKKEKSDWQTSLKEWEKLNNLETKKLPKDLQEHLDNVLKNQDQEYKIFMASNPKFDIG